jgi:outer membrane protein TolC
VSAGADATAFTAPAFNIGTLQPARQIVTSQVVASYDLFLGGRQLANVRRATTALESAEARETQTRFGTALATTADYYAVVTERELRRVAADRVRRAEEQLAVARARVQGGAVVQSDSLQVLLEVTRARQELLERDAALRVAQLQLGRRVGAAGPVDAATADTSAPPRLPLPVEEAITQAAARGPAYLAARADERAAEAALRVERSAYLPRVTLAAGAGAFDRRLLPNQTYRSQFAVAISLPLWDAGARELAVAQARVARDVAAARREDLERGAAQAVTAAYTNYTTARTGIELATVGVGVARETYRVQDVRYRGGATTILDVLEAQGALTRAEADLVQARRRARVALAELEAVLGRRLFPTQETR